MNIFEYLGLDKDHRSKDKVVQKVKHFDEVPESKKKWPMFLQLKKDGVYALVVNSPEVLPVVIFSRTGKRFSNCSNLALSLNLAYGVYIAELCSDDCSQPQLSGIVNPKRTKPLTSKQQLIADDMYLAFHDYLSIEDFIKGSSDISYDIRYHELERLALFNGIIPIHVVYNEKRLNDLFKAYIKRGEEGIVVKQPNEGWIAGHKGYRQMKKVRGVSYDLMCIGAEEGKGKYKGLVANLFFKYKDTKIKCMLGKGWTHSDAKTMWENYRDGGLESPIGEIFEVYAMQESTKGKLRQPKVGEFRHDKTKTDC